MREIIILKNYILYILCGFLICMVGISNVFADSYTYEDIGYFSSQSQVQVEVNYTSQPLTIALNQHVQLEQVFSLDIFVNNLNLPHDYIYYFEIYLPSTVLTRANMAQVIWYGDNNATGNCTVVSTYFSNNYPHVTFKCNGSTNIKSLYIKYYNSSNQYLFDAQQFYWNYTFIRRRSPSSTDNTGEIKDALNQQTEDIINNQNSNTQEIIDSNKVCNTIDSSYIIQNNKKFNSSGGIESSNAYAITDHIELGSTFEVVQTAGGTSAYFCWYTSSKSLISCQTVASLTTSTQPPSNAKYFRTSIDTAYDAPKLKICKNGNQALTDTLKDDDVDTSQATDFFQNFNDNTHGLSGIISAPLNAINSMLNNQCSPLTATWKGKTISFECGYSFWQRLIGFQTFLNVALDGLLCYRILSKLFKLIEKLKNPNDDRVEVMDL